MKVSYKFVEIFIYANLHKKDSLIKEKMKKMMIISIILY